MDFDEIKVIWHSQDRQPLYAVDEAALHAMVRRRAQRFGRLVTYSQAAMIVAWVGLAMLYLVDPLVNGEQYHRLVPAAILAALALRLTFEIVRRRSAESRFDRSVRGELDRAVWQVDEHVRWARALRWWYVAPFVAAISIDVAVRPGAQAIWAWVAAVVVVGAAAGATEWEIRSQYLPKKQRLVELREKLIAAGR